MLKKLTQFVSDPSVRTFYFHSKHLLDCLDDKTLTQLVFKAKLGYPINLTHPQSFNEKVSWQKLYDRDPRYTQMVDKYQAKEYAGHIIGEEHIIPTIGLWNSVDEIDFDSLPDKFVLKCTHDSGGTVVCRDKNTLDINSAKKKLNYYLHRNYYKLWREWPYKDVPHKIIAEILIEDDSSDSESNELTDYKFYCFNGKAEFMYISKGLTNHATAVMSFYDFNGNELPFKRSDYRSYQNAPMPANLQEMITIANHLAEDINSLFVRVDLYSVNGCIYFSEITFSPCAGMTPFEPAEYDFELGEMINMSGSKFKQENK